MSLDELIHEFVKSWFELHPHRATEKGQVGLDHLTADYRNENVEQFLCRVADLQITLQGLDVGELGAEQWTDYQLLKSQLDAVRHPFLHGRVLSQNPVFYLQAGLDGLESLRHRYKEPPWEHLQERLEGLVRLLDVAQAQLTEPKSPAIEVSLEMAADAHGDLRSTVFHSDTPESVRLAGKKALSKLNTFRGWLSEQTPQEFVPMGPEAFDSLLKKEHLLERHWSVWESEAKLALENTERQLSIQKPVRTEPNTLSGPDDVWAYYREEMDRVREFLEQAEIVTIPQGELLLCQTPSYLESLIPGPFYSEPAIFSGARVGRFYMPALPQAWTPEVAARYAKKKTSGAFTNLVVHEAWPGHHLQFLHAAVHHHPLRNLRDNDVMLEGWALYCEELMEELGLHINTPFLPRLHSLKFRALRVLLDTGIHTGRLTLVEAEQLMMQHLPAASINWARAEVRRYALEPGQALSYWVGAEIIKEIKSELGIQRKQYRDFHDALLSFGAIPLPLIRERLRSTFSLHEESRKGHDEVL